MTVVVYTKDATAIAWGEQATWGTGLAGTDDYNGTTPEWGEELRCEIVPIDFASNKREPNASDNGVRYLRSSNFGQDTKGSAPKFIVTGDARKNTLPSFLYATMQAVTEDGSTPYEKAFVFGSNQPDFTASAGWFGTLWLANPGSNDQRIIDVICSELTLSCKPDEGQGRMQMVANLIGRGTADTAGNLTATVANGRLVPYANSFFYFHDIKACTIDGNAIAPLSVSWTIKNNAVPVGTNNAGAFLTFALPRYEVEFTIQAVWDSNSAAQQALIMSSNTPVPIVVTWGTDNNDGYFTLPMYGIPVSAEDAYDPIKSITLTYKGAYDGTNAIFAPVIADALDRGW